MAGSSNPKTLYLIDGHAQFFRAYHAIQTRMSSPVTNEPTNMTYGFVGILIKLMRDYAPDYLAVAIDVSGDRESFRSEIYPEYKANRERTPDDFHPQVDRCLQILGELSIPVIGESGVEADDVIATIVRRLTAEHPELAIRIVSRDKDLAQLVGERVELLDIYKEAVVTPSDVFKTEGVAPEQVADILALMGDTSDNIPGVPGIGPKTAAKLILEYGTIDNLLAHLDEIKGKRRENLEASLDQIAVARKLVQLVEDVDIELDLDAARFEPARIDTGAILATFRELNFGLHRDNIRRLVHGDAADDGDAEPAAGVAPPAPGEPAGLFDHLGGTAPSVPRDAGEYETITTAAQLDELVASLRGAARLAVDTETVGLGALQSPLCGISLSTAPRTGCYVPVRSPDPSAHLDEATVLDALRPILEDAAIAKIGHNLKYDIEVLGRRGVQLAGDLFDTMIASYVLDATRSSHRLDVLALAVLQHTTMPIDQLIGSGSKQKGFDQVALDAAGPYAAEDADIALRLADAFAEQLAAQELEGLFRDVEMPLVEVLADMETAGIRVDPDELDRQREALASRIDGLRREIIDASPHVFNPDSPKQLAAALFNAPDQEPPGLGLRVIKRGKTGPSTDVEVLEKLAEDATVDTPVPGLIVEYRQLTKLVNTYLTALKEVISPRTGRVHASFNQTVAATGRLSSSDPNLQNIPIRTPIGREIRRAFIAEDGHVLLTADYSQIELRILAHLAEDPALVEAFHRGEDIHAAVAAEVFGVDPADVTGAQRNTAKMVNFGIVYGITPFGLARRLGGGTTVNDAKHIIEDYKTRFSRISAFLDSCVHEALEKGYVETILGRRRAVPQVRARHPQQRALGERMAINTVVQGSAADLIKLAMIHLHGRLPTEHPTAQLVLQIHDELVFEVPEGDVESLRDFVVREMEHAMELRVPLGVESAWSSNWIDAK